MKNYLKKIICPNTIIFCFLLASCNATKLVPKGDALYTGAKVKVEDSTLSRNEKNKVLDQTEHLPRPKPNAKFLGMSIKLFFYNLAGDPKKKGFIRKFLRNIGEPPVLLSSANLDYNVKVLQNHLENIGYFHAIASGDTTVKKKKGSATYILEPRNLYTIKDVNFLLDSSALGKAIMETRSGSLLHTGDPFNLEVIKGERSRIDAILKEEGYYYFSPDLLILDADSTVGNDNVNLYLQVKEGTPPVAKKPYIIDNVVIYPNYRLNAPNQDTTLSEENIYKGYYIVDPRNRFKPKLFPRILRFDSGDVYSRKDHNLTLNRLINLDVFKFVKNRFDLSPTSEGDTGRLNTFYYLTPMPRKSLRAEISGNTKSNNYVGTLLTLTFRNRNTFRGAEHLDIHANVGSEVQYSGTQSGFNSYRFGAGITFGIPKFVVPFFHFNTTSAYVPKTKIELDYDFLNRRKLYTLNSFLAELGYLWKPSITKQHEFNPFSINYVHPVNITQLYLDSLKKDPTLRQAVDTQFVIGSNYQFTWDPLTNDPKGTGFYFNGLTDLSGFVAGLFTQPNPDKGNQKTIFGSAFNQYVKGQADLRYYYAFSDNSRLANRIILGMGYPYGNSRSLPFIKQFFIGGNNSIRAFRSRSIGPGTYRAKDADSAAFFPDQSGDIKIELNSELRLKINNILEAALFVDAGNIWLYNTDPNKPGAKFSKDFLKEFAVGAGLGLRFDLQILLLRIDIAAPLRKPYLPQGERWVIDEFNFADRDWRRQNIVLNLAIGYPF